MGPGEFLKIARIRAGYKSAAAAARAFGWSLGTYGGHENGYRAITVAAAKRYARAFGIKDVSLLLDIGSAEDDLEDVRRRVRDRDDRSLPYEHPRHRHLVVRPPSAKAPAQELFADSRLAEALTVLADAYRELNAPGRKDLLVKFWHFFPELKARRLRGRGGKETSSRPRKERRASAGG